MILNFPSFFNKFNTATLDRLIYLPIIFVIGMAGSLGSLYSLDEHWFFIFSISSFVIASLFCKLNGLFGYWFCYWFSFFNAPLFMSYLAYIKDHPTSWVFMGVFGVSVYAFFFAIAFVLGSFIARRFFKNDLFISFGFSVLFSILFFYFLQSIFPIAPISPGLTLAFSPFVGFSSLLGNLGLNFLFFLFSFAFFLFFVHLRLISFFAFLVCFFCYLLIPSLSETNDNNSIKSVSIYFYNKDVKKPLDVDIILGNEFGFKERSISNLKPILAHFVKNTCVDCDLIGHFSNMDPKTRKLNSSLFFYNRGRFHSQLKTVIAFPSEISLLRKLKSGIQNPLGNLSDHDAYIPYRSSKTGLNYGGLICLDSSFPEVARKVALSGVDLLFNPSSVNSFFSYYLMSSLIASNIVSSIASGHIIVKSLLSYESLIFNPNGKFLKIDRNKQINIVPVFSINTFYLHWGSFFSLLILVFSLTTLLSFRIIYVKFN